MIAIRTSLRLVKAPPKLTVSQWAEQSRYLSRDGGAAIRWRNETAPYLVEIMDCVSDPLVQTIVYDKPTQVGGTEVINNVIGYYIDRDPCKIMYAQQILDMTETYSKEILQPMFRDTPCLRERVREVKSRDSNSTILRKVFPGGSLRMVGANSPRGFRMTPQRVVIGDDVDGFESNAGDEGDPVALMIARTSTHPDRKIILVSSPTIQYASRIDTAYQQSDRRVWEVPCPNCQHRQVLMWAGVKWPSPDHTGVWYSATHQPDKVRYLCDACSYPMEHRHKREMNLAGAWRATAAFTGTAGFWHNALVSAFETWEEIVKQFLTTKNHPDQFKVFVNTKLAETWKVKLGEQLHHEVLYHRREEYGPSLPDGVVLLTCGVDVQETRIEAEVKGWGVGEESWGIEHRIFYGTTTQPLFPAEPDPAEQPNAWRQLSEYLLKTWSHPSGELRLVCTFIDSGFRSKEVYQFVKRRQMQRVYAIKGSSERACPIVNMPRKKVGGVLLILIGTDAAKGTIYTRLQQQDKGPGYYHWPMSYQEEYFKQVVAEELIPKMRHGVRYHLWELPAGKKNEALDLNVYNFAALSWLVMRQGANLERLKAQMQTKPVAAVTPEPPRDPVPVQKFHPAPFARKHFVRGW